MPDKKDPTKGVEIPSDLASLTDADLALFIENATVEFDQITDDEAIDADGLARATQLAESIEAAQGQVGEREAVLAQQKADRDALRNRVHGDPNAVEDGEPAEDSVDESVVEESAPAEPALVASGRLTLARSPKYHRPRGPSCMRGECDGCLGACPEDAVIKLAPGHRYEFDYDRCTGCGACYEQCPVHSIEMVPEDS